MKQKKQLSLYKKLYSKQRSVADFCLSREAAALFIEQRGGKTYITGAVIEKMVLEDPNFYGLLVVPLTNKLSTWSKLIEKYLPYIEIQLELEKPKKSKPTICLLHYEQAAKIYKKLGRRKWSLAVFDESQRLKGRTTSQSKLARNIKFAKKKIILSGTPIDKTPLDLWPQFRFLAPEVFGTKWTSFKEAYLRPAGYMGKKPVLRKSKTKKFHEKIAPYCIRISKKDLSIKKAKTIRCPVNLKGSQKALYEEIEADMVSEWKGNEVSSGLKITQNILLQQICGGFVRDDEGYTHKVGVAKLKKLESLLKRVELPVVIFCKYRREVQAATRVCRSLGLKTAIIRGGSRNKALRPQILAKFQQGKYDALVSQIRTGGVGVDLWRSSTAIMYSITYSHIDFEQAKSRIDAIGKKQSSKIYLIYARNSIDEDIYSIILSKKSASDRLLNNIKKRRLQWLNQKPKLRH